MFNWSNRMIGSEDPEYQTDESVPQQAAMELYAYASALFEAKRIDPHEDLMSVLTDVEMEGEKLNSVELELFFLLLTVAGNETTRNLISGGMAAFFDHPDQWEMLRNDRSLLPSATEEMLRYVSPVMNFRRQTTRPSTSAASTSRRTPRWSSSTSRPTVTSPCSRPPDLRHHPRPEPPHGLRRRRPPLLPGGQPGPYGDPGDVRAPARPHARDRTRRRGAASCSPPSSVGSSTSPSPSRRRPGSRPDAAAADRGQPQRGHPGLPAGPGHRGGPTPVRRTGYHRCVDGRDRRRGRRGQVHRLRLLRQPRRAAAGLSEGDARTAPRGHRRDVGAGSRARPSAPAPDRGHAGAHRRQPGLLPAGPADPGDRRPGRRGGGQRAGPHRPQHRPADHATSTSTAWPPASSGTSTRTWPSR